MLKLFVYDENGGLVEVTPSLLRQVGMTLEQFQAAYECVTKYVPMTPAPVQQGRPRYAGVPAYQQGRPLDTKGILMYTVAFALLLLALGTVVDLPGPLSFVSGVSDWVIASIFSDDVLTIDNVTPAVVGGNPLQNDDNAGGGAPTITVPSLPSIVAQPAPVLGGDPATDSQAGGGVPPSAMIVTAPDGTTYEVVDGRSTTTDLVTGTNPSGAEQADSKPAPTNCREDAAAMMTVCDPPAAPVNASTGVPASAPAPVAPAAAPPTTYQVAPQTTYTQPNYTPANPITTGQQPSQEAQYNQALQEGLSAFNSGSCPAFSSCQ